MFKKKIVTFLLSIFIIISTLFFPNITVKASGIDGWKQTGTTVSYYIDGNKETNWVLVKSKWYYFDAKGAMVAGSWIKYDDKTYYLNADGEMVTGWILSKVTDMWYYLGSNGAMTVNTWINYNGRSYYLNTDGDMALSTITPDGYLVGTDGAWNGTGVIKQDARIGKAK